MINTRRVTGLINKLNQKNIGIKEISIYDSLENVSILRVLEGGGYITIRNIDKKNRIIWVIKNKQDMVLKQISKSGRRIYRSCLYLHEKTYKEGLGDYIIRTSKGIMLNRYVHLNKVGGEVLFSIM